MNNDNNSFPLALANRKAVSHTTLQYSLLEQRPEGGLFSPKLAEFELIAGNGPSFGSGQDTEKLTFI
jgi:hypothetical protein